MGDSVGKDLRVLTARAGLEELEIINEVVTRTGRNDVQFRERTSKSTQDRMCRFRLKDGSRPTHCGSAADKPHYTATQPYTK